MDCLHISPLYHRNGHLTIAGRLIVLNEITAHKQAERAVQESEFKRNAHASSYIIFVFSFIFVEDMDIFSGEKVLNLGEVDFFDTISMSLRKGLWLQIAKFGVVPGGVLVREGVIKGCTSEVGGGEDSTAQVGSFKVGVTQVSIDEIGITQIGSFKMSILQLGIDEEGTPCVYFVEIRAVEIALTEIPIAQVTFIENMQIDVDNVHSFVPFYIAGQPRRTTHHLTLPSLLLYISHN